MGKKKIIVLFDTVDEGFELIEETYDLTRPAKGEHFTYEQLQEMDKDYEVMLSLFSKPVTAEMMDLYPNLKLIANYGVGFNNIDLEHAWARGIKVTNTPKSVIVPTAELTMGLMLDCSRRIGEWERMMRRNKSSEKRLDDNGMAMDLFGKTVGIIGFGNIGRRVAELCQAFGMKVLYNKRSRLTNDEEEALKVTYATLEEIYRNSDVVALHMPYNNDSHHMINEEALKMMKPSAIVVNAARGKVVDEAALVKALQSGEIAAAGLDVFEHDDNPLAELYEMENVCMTPHVGTQTYDSRVAMARELCNNVVGFYENDRPVSYVLPQ